MKVNQTLDQPLQFGCQHLHKNSQTPQTLNGVAVAEARLVKGIQEKAYRIAQSLHLDANNMAGLNADDHLGYFTNYVLTLLRDFSNYLTATAETNGEIDMLADRIGCTEVRFFANKEELDQFGAALNQARLPGRVSWG